jgi:hypothetical protein
LHSPVELGVLTVGTDSILHGLTIDRVTPGVNTDGRQGNQALGEGHKEGCRQEGQRESGEAAQGGRQVIRSQAGQGREANLACWWQPTNRQG